MTPRKPAPSAPPRTHRLSKSRYVAGLQCPKLLWWKVHEPDAPELAPEDNQEAILERVGALARTFVPGGVLIDLPHYEVEERVLATAKALAAGAPAVYEASFFVDDIFVSVDILERRKRGFVLTEVKSTTKIKKQHLPDVAVQVHVARRAGLRVDRAEVMHLNPACRHPRLTNLFVRKAVTRAIGPLLHAVPAQLGSMLSMLAGPLLEVPTGAHCTKPYRCPFMERCWPDLPEHHVSTLYTGPRRQIVGVPTARVFAMILSSLISRPPGLSECADSACRDLAFIDLTPLSGPPRLLRCTQT